MYIMVLKDTEVPRTSWTSTKWFFFIFKIRLQCEFFSFFSDYIYHIKKGSQQARNADIMMPKVRAAFLSRFILLLEAAGRNAPESGSVSTSTSFTASDVDRAPRALIPFICKCLFNNAAATLLLKKKRKKTYFELDVSELFDNNNWCCNTMQIIMDCRSSVSKCCGYYSACADIIGSNCYYFPSSIYNFIFIIFFFKQNGSTREYV